MVSRILAFRPATVVGRLDPANAACPLSLRDLLLPATELELTLPVVRSPVAGVARGALVAAKETGSALGLALPPGVAPEPWFAAVTTAADEIAAGLPIFLSGEVVVEGGEEAQVERAFNQSWRLVDAGITHVAVDVDAVGEADRARVLHEVARAAFERGICVDCVVPLEQEGEIASVSHTAALFDALARQGSVPDVASVRCRAANGRGEARAQLRRLAEICSALSGIPVMRRGMLSSEVIAELRGSPVKACEDGGAAATSAIAAIPWERVASAEEPHLRETPLERAASELSEEGATRLEARAYVVVADLVEGLGAAGSARSLARALEAELGET